jgi:hypothetical protein
MPSGPTKRALVLLPLAALLAILPLLIHGGSCGQDQVFHLQSWFDAAQQLRHGHYPRWAFTAAWNAGEPRFQFYPPLSWLLGAVLTMVLPPNAAPITYILIALTAAALGMYWLAKSFVSPEAALLAAALYLANPYMLFNAFERSALAELLAAAWIPLLLLGILRARPTVRGIALPLALLWLTNAPAAVMGSYTLALLATLRVAHFFFGSRDRRQTLRFALNYVSGTVLGLALPAFYLIPAAVERKYVQVAMAIIPNMRYQDNFLFRHTADAAHNAVNHTASTLALSLLVVIVLTLSALYLSRRAKKFHNLTIALALVTLLITVLLVPLSTPIWQHLPELAFLQFPWRMLTILSAVLAFSLALLLNRSKMTSSYSSLLYSLSSVLILSFFCYHLYAQACDPHDVPANIASLLKTHHGLGPTDEYTPNAADNDLLRTDNPGYWLAAHLNDPAPGTIPTPSELHPDIATDDSPVPVEQTLSTTAPHHLALSIPQPRVLIFNLRDYPNWQVTMGCETCLFFKTLPHLQRDDGLLAIPLPTGAASVDITWHRTFDQNVGLGITALALLDLVSAFAINLRKKRRS